MGSTQAGLGRFARCSQKCTSDQAQENSGEAARKLALFAVRAEPIQNRLACHDNKYCGKSGGSGVNGFDPLLGRCEACFLDGISELRWPDIHPCRAASQFRIGGGGRNTPADIEEPVSAVGLPRVGESVGTEELRTARFAARQHRDRTKAPNAMRIESGRGHCIQFNFNRKIRVLFGPLLEVPVGVFIVDSA